VRRRTAAPRSASAARGARERVVRPDLVVAVGPDPQDVRQLGVAREPLDQLERRGVAPLQVVEEDHGRVALAREGPDQRPKRRVEPVRRLGRRQLRDRRRIAEQARQLRQGVEQHAGVGRQRGRQLAAPGRDAPLRLAEDLQQVPAQRLGQRRVGGVARELVELAAAEVPAVAHQRSVDLPDQRRLADARGAGEQHQLVAAARCPLERGLHRRHVVLAAVQGRGQQEPLADVALAERELGRAGAAGRVRHAPEVREQPGRALVAGLRRLRQQPQDQPRQRRGDVWSPLVRRHRHAGDVGVDQLHRVDRVERRRAGQHLVVRRAERVEVAAVVDGSVHATGLLGGEVGEAALEHLEHPEVALLLGEDRRDAEVRERDAPEVGVDDDVVGLDVLVQHAARVDGRDGAGDARRDRQEDGEGQAATRDALGERRPAEVLEHEHGPRAELDEAPGPDHRVVAEPGEDRVLVAQPGDVPQRRVLASQRLQHDPHAVGLADGAEDHRASALPQHLLDGVAGDLDHTRGPSGRVIHHAQTISTSCSGRRTHNIVGDISSPGGWRPCVA
jgi:hypothetical protein